ncbi:hypothetical protein ABPG77_009196 [Micractinium sp. CCAP 211/92]
MLRSSLVRQAVLYARSSTPTGAVWVPAAAAAGGAPAAAVGALHTSSALLASILVKIPALGESISDGTVAAVLKEAGQRVEEDEPILQIETDKVTVDVRAPSAGVVEAILVKQDDTVEVGTAVASIAAGATAAAEAPAPQQAQQQAQQQAAPEAAAAPPPPPPPQAAPAEAAPTHRTPSIRFPPRVAPSGERISSLPAAEAQSLLTSLLGGDAEGTAPDAARAPDPAQYKNMIAVPIVGGSMPVLRGMPVPSGQPGPPRRTMSEGEMEAIMLGGAEP